MSTSKEIDVVSLIDHPAIKSATEVYLKTNRNVEAVKDWFTEKYKKNFTMEQLSAYFKKYVDPQIDNYEIEKENKIKTLQETVSANRSVASNHALTQAMVLEFIKDIYANKKNGPLNSKEDRDVFFRLASSLKDLVKTYTDGAKFELEVIGFGKTEEEQIAVMKSFLNNKLIEIISVFDDLPEAQDRLKELLNIAPAGGDVLKKDEKFVEDEDDEDDE